MVAIFQIWPPSVSALPVRDGNEDEDRTAFNTELYIGTNKSTWSLQS